MNIEIATSELQKRKLFVATPMYGGQCHGMYTKACADLAKLCQSYNVECKFFYLFNESLITRARNYCGDEFLRSDCDYLMFIDSDIGFDYKDVLTLLHFAGSDGYDIITAPYPKKTIAWEKVKSAVDLGYGKDNPFQLQEFVGDYVFNPVDGIKSFSVTEPVEIKEGGTGFMMIPRKTFEKYEEAYPELKYIPD